jgi:xylan 1,4-beta-xylosidase
MNCPMAIRSLWVIAVLLLGTICAAAEPLRQLRVNAASAVGTIRSLQGVDGLPGGTDPGGRGVLEAPDLRSQWRAAHVDAVRTYIWHARLDTVDNPASLFPRWDADPLDATSYNFAATDAAVRASREVGAEILFTLATSIPSNTRPPSDIAKYAEVAKHIAAHFNEGWANGFVNAVRYWEIGDEPDLSTFHFSGTPQQFYGMYEATARAIKSLDPSLQVGGPGLAFPLNDIDAPYRDGFLDAVNRRSIPLDFFSWKWYSDGTEDPYDIPRVTNAITKVLARNGLVGVKQFITNWNFNAIPTARPDPWVVAAFDSAALTYMQDTILARAFLFRGDAGMGTAKNPDPDFTNRTYEQDGSPRPSGYSFEAIGRMLETPERLAVKGGDENGFAVIAGRDSGHSEVQILITNYSINPHYLKPTSKTSLDFDLPVATARVSVSMMLPTRRVNAVAHDNGGYDLIVTGLPWKTNHYTIFRYRIDRTHNLTLVDRDQGAGATAHVSAQLPPPSVELVIVRKDP